METAEKLITDLRRQRDEAAARGDHAEALILNDRIRDLKDGRISPTVETVTRQFESALARKRYIRPQNVGECPGCFRKSIGCSSPDCPMVTAS